MGLTSALAKTVPQAGVPLVGALSFAGLNRIEWILRNSEEVQAEGAQINLDQEKLEQTMGLLAAIFVSTEIWAIKKLIGNPAAAAILQEGVEKAAAGELTEEAAEVVAVKAGARAGISRLLGKVLLVDTVVWAITGANRS